MLDYCQVLRLLTKTLRAHDIEAVNASLRNKHGPCVEIPESFPRLSTDLQPREPHKRCRTLHPT